MSIKSIIKKMQNENGQALVDYGLIISLVVLVVITGLIAVAGGIENLYGIITGEFPVIN